jgi:DNA-binding NarL/FixJ family response regulator
MRNWEVPGRDRADDSFLPPGETWHGSREPGRTNGNMRLPSLARQASWDVNRVPFTLVPSGASESGDDRGRPRGAPGDRSAREDPALRSPDRGDDQVTVVVCDRLPVLALGLAKLLEEEAPNLHVMSVGFSSWEARRWTAQLRPAVAVIGLSADRVEDVQAVREICAAFPETRVVVLLWEDEVTLASDALLGAGVAGYALKESDASEIADVVTLVARGHVVAPDAVALAGERQPRSRILDDVEAEILKGVARSETNRALAARLHLSERTISRRLEGIYSKLDLADRLQAAVYAATHGLVTSATWRGDDRTFTRGRT